MKLLQLAAQDFMTYPGHSVLLVCQSPSSASLIQVI